jgi:Tfp pilus assembly protein PilF
LLGLAQFSLKDYAQAETSAMRAIQLDPKTPGAYTLLARIELAKGSAENAKANLRKGIATFPGSTLNYMELAILFEHEGNWAEAKKLVEEAHRIDPAAPVVAAELAFLYLEHGGDVNTAVSLAQIAKRQMPNSSKTADLLGWAYCKLGSHATAITHLKEAVQKEPTNPIFQYHLATAYLGIGDHATARRIFQKVLKSDPEFRYAAEARTALQKASLRP